MKEDPKITLDGEREKAGLVPLSKARAQQVDERIPQTGEASEPSRQRRTTKVTKLRFGLSALRGLFVRSVEDDCDL